MNTGQRNTILKQRLLRLLKSEIKVLIQSKNWSVASVRFPSKKNDLKREFDKLSLEQKRIKEVVKHIQICISKREHYEGYRKNPNDRIYMMMNRKDV